MLAVTGFGTQQTSRAAALTRAARNIMLVIHDQKHFDTVVDFAKQANLYDIDEPGALKHRL